MHTNMAQKVFGLSATVYQQGLFSREADALKGVDITLVFGENIVPGVMCFACVRECKLD